MRPSDAGCPGFGRRSLGLNPLSRRLCLGLFFVLAGCGREAPQVDGVDLVQMFPLAHARHEIGDLAPGDPDAGPAFTSGWSGDGSTWWGVGDRSVLTFIDTLRADHLGVYGYPRPVSPRIDALASEGTVFSRASAPTSWTRPSIVSLFTGLHPQTHGVNGTHDGLAEGPATLAELLRSLGYSTVGFTTNGNVHPKFGLGRGFDRYEHLSGGGRKGEPYRSSRVINRTVERWLEQRDGAPFFLFLHTIDRPTGPSRPGTEASPPAWPIPPSAPSRRFSGSTPASFRSPGSSGRT